MPSKSITRFWALIAAASSSVAVGQLVTPPPVANPDPNTDIPKAPVPPPVAPQSAPTPVQPIRAAKPVKEPLPDLPWKEWEKGADGKLLPLTEPLELASLRRNPLVTTDIMAKVEAYMPERRKSVQRIVIENLDLVESIDGGLFERTDFENKAEVGKVVDATKPLQLVNLAGELKNRQIIDDKTFGFNAKIATARTKLEFPPADPNDDAATKRKKDMKKLGQIYKQVVNEEIWVYNELVFEAAKQVPGVKAGGSKAETIAAVKAAMKDMTLDQRKDLFRKVAGLPKPEPKPAAATDVKAESKAETKAASPK